MSHILNKLAPIGEARDRELLKDAATYIYTNHSQGDLRLYAFRPPELAAPPHPLIVFFHGGLWDVSAPAQFVPHCLHFASRGAVAVVAETRVSSRHDTGAPEAAEDACEVIHWLADHADTFDIDLSRIAVGGAAGGAFLALHTVMPKSPRCPAAAPRAVVLFSAITETGSQREMHRYFPDARTAKRMSPMKLVRRKLPPMILFHGTHDRIAPFANVERFVRKLRFRGNRIELADFEKEDHSFFNFNMSHRHFEMTVAAADRFLVTHGILSAETRGS
jgi:acetyl esterase